MNKKCTKCGQVKTWHELPLVGYQADGLGGHLELRNCPPPCSSTLAIERSGPPPSGEFAATE